VLGEVGGASRRGRRSGTRSCRTGGPGDERTICRASFSRRRSGNERAHFGDEISPTVTRSAWRSPTSITSPVRAVYGANEHQEGPSLARSRIQYSSGREIVVMLRSASVITQSRSPALVQYEEKRRSPFSRESPFAFQSSAQTSPQSLA